jgi:alanine or glycine:cation symporter, AGCS family
MFPIPIPESLGSNLLPHLFFTVIFVGATATLDAVWLFVDVMNRLMAILNLIGLLGFSGVIVFETRHF